MWQWNIHRPPLVLRIVHSSTVPSPAGVANTELVMENGALLTKKLVPAEFSLSVMVRRRAIVASASGGGRQVGVAGSTGGRDGEEVS